ncbi:MAG: serine/threonine-protein kinase [Candidatus Xenobia bacterium]
MEWLKSARPPTWQVVGKGNEPERVGPYLVLGVLGEGAMARVYRAMREGPVPRGLAREVALKRLLSRDPEHVTRFGREILIGQKLKHVNLCKVIDWGLSQDNRVYFAMELLDGEVLTDFLDRRAPLTPLQFRAILAPLLQGLQVVHQAGIVHRDLKPGNVFLTRDGTLKIMDFGIASGAGLSVTRTGTAVGSMHYMSPEQVVDSKHIDARSDLYSVGVIAFWMLTRRFPTEGDSMAIILTRLMEHDLLLLGDLRPDLPVSVVTWVHCLLSHRPEDRFATAQQALAMLP